MKNKENKLGRGLSSLICKEDFDELLEKPPGINVVHVNIENVFSNKNQPRKNFNQEALEELAASIKQKGIISPILVRKNPQGKYEIIAGERRYRAAKLAGLSVIPILLKEVDDTIALELSIIENVQRQDLNIVEEAKAYHALMDNYSYSQNDISDIVGKSRSHIANILRLLSLPEAVIELLKIGKINLGQAKILVGKDNVEQLADKIINENLNVRQVEALIKKGGSGEKSLTSRTSKLRKVQKDEDIELIEALLQEKANLNVKIDNVKRVVQIFYSDLVELDKVLQLLSSK